VVAWAVAIRLVPFPNRASLTMAECSSVLAAPVGSLKTWNANLYHASGFNFNGDTRQGADRQSRREDSAARTRLMTSTGLTDADVVVHPAEVRRAPVHKRRTFSDQSLA
jgi:hypothetical protein